MGAVLLSGPCTAGRCEIEWRGRPASSDEEGTLKRAKRELMLNSATLVDTRHGSELPGAGAPPPWVDKTYGVCHPNFALSLALLKPSPPIQLNGGGETLEAGWPGLC